MKSISQYGQTIIELSEFVKQLDESVRLEAFKFLLASELGNLTQNPSPPTKGIPHDQQPRAVAPQELIRRSGASSFTEKAVVLAYWLEKYQQRPIFSSGDLKAVFDQAREQSAKNPSDLIAKLETTARVMKAEKVGSVQHYRLTSTALADVERSLNSETEKK